VTATGAIALGDGRELVELAWVVRGVPGTALEFVPGLAGFGEAAFDVMVDMSLAGDRPINWNVIRVVNADRSAFASLLAPADAASIESPWMLRTITQWEHLEVAETFARENAAAAGRSISDIAAERAASPFAVMLDIAVLDDLRTNSPYPRRATTRRRGRCGWSWCGTRGRSSVRQTPERTST
jgi:hypothetical protein